MKSLKENINTLLMLLCELTAGVLLLIDHNGFLSVILMGAESAKSASNDIE